MIDDIFIKIFLGSLTLAILIHVINQFMQIISNFKAMIYLAIFVCIIIFFFNLCTPPDYRIKDVIKHGYNELIVLIDKNQDKIDNFLVWLKKPFVKEENNEI
jgi:predicted PurR-regulated permease PerM